MPLPNLGPAYDLAQRVARLEAMVRQLAGAQIGQAFSAKQSDGSVGMQITQNTDGNGSLGTTWFQSPGVTSRDPNTGYHPSLLYIGQLFVNGQPSAAGLILYRSNGQQTMALGDGGFELRELSGTIAISTDQVAKEGLATPWVPLPTPAQTGVANWPKTTGSGAVASSNFHAQHPKVWWNAQAYADSGSSGTVQLVLSGPNGASVSSPVYNVASAAFTSIDVVLTLPQPFMGTGWTANVNATATGGGNVYCQTYSLYGRQS